MQYAYEVKHDGVYYPAGADVPDGVEDNGMGTNGVEAPTDEQEKPKKGKKN